MSYKKRDFEIGKMYHVFNKTVDGKTPFINTWHCQTFLLTCFYYRVSDLQTRFSVWKRLDTKQRNIIKEQLNDPAKFQVHIIAYCLMPNHFHFILKQITPHGIQNFISNISNSFTRAYNTEHTRKGPLFLRRFHDVPITSAQQLLTTSRYIHRNPIAHMTRFNDSFRKYPWSSYKDYLEISTDPLKLIDPKPILAYFNNNPKQYQKLVEDDLY